jgi:hypothetical protein
MAPFHAGAPAVVARGRRQPLPRHRLPGSSGGAVSAPPERLITQTPTRTALGGMHGAWGERFSSRLPIPMPYRGPMPSALGGYRCGARTRSRAEQCQRDDGDVVASTVGMLAGVDDDGIIICAPPPCPAHAHGRTADRGCGRVRAQPRADVDRQHDPPVGVPRERQLGQLPLEAAALDPAGGDRVVQGAVSAMISA